MISAGFLPPISMTSGRGIGRAPLSRINFMPTSFEPVKTMPSMPALSTSSWPTTLPLPVTKLKTPAGKPASAVASYSFRPRNGVSVAGLNTTVLPATSAPPAGPAASASGKLNGEITAQTPCGRSTLRFSSLGPSVPIGVAKPPCCSSWSQ